MSRHVVIGTAGHVDHGKTALVKGLTGTDTDRHPEERRRGITIDIGFASLQLDDGTQASLVDVPGHEDFIRNMVAGASGIDIALLVVAADEGVMPQTAEHLAILDFLGIRNGVVALTKADLAEPDWLELVRSDVRERLGSTGLHWEESVPVSVTRGEGLDALRAALTRAAARTPGRSADDLFRMPVDRVFSLAGAGTVMTGTTWSGTVSIGDDVLVLPQGIPARVRSVEVHGERREGAPPGRRTALALPAVERAAVQRGSVVVADASWRCTTALDVQMTLLARAGRGLTQRSRVRCLLGTAEVMARITPLGDSLAPGETGTARLRLEAPVVARWGDRIIIRAYSPVSTIGGAVVIDPWPQSRPRRPVDDPRRLSPDPVERVGTLVELSGRGGLPVEELAVRAGVAANEVPLVVERVCSGGAIVRVKDMLFPSQIIAGTAQRIRAMLTGHHRAYPWLPGMAIDALRAGTGGNPVTETVLTSLAAEGDVVLEAGTVRLSGHRATLNSAQEEAGQALLDALAAAGREGATTEELSRQFPDGTVGRLLEYYVRGGTAVRVGADRYYHQLSLDRVSREVLGEVDRRGQATVSQLRDAVGLTRKFLIPLLEWLDNRGLTIRSGDARSITPAGRRWLDAVPGGP